MPGNDRGVVIEALLDFKLKHASGIKIMEDTPIRLGDRIYMEMELSGKGTWLTQTKKR